MGSSPGRPGYFSDEDALCRNVSIDFTLPHWFHNFRGTPEGEAKRQLVPLGFFRKEAIAHFGLSDETCASLPLLTAPQTLQVSEAVLLKLGELSLGEEVPQAIRHDIHALIYEPPTATAAVTSYKRLFSAEDSASRQRKLLAQETAFMNTALQFQDSFLALTMVNIRHHERRVIHFTFEEQLRGSSTFRRMLLQAVGDPRRVAIAVTAPSGAASYHLEVEAPEGLMITNCFGYHYVSRTAVNRVPAAFTMRRAHCHFTNAPPRSTAGVDIYLQPRRSSVVRAATLTAGLVVVSTAAIGARFPRIEEGDNAAAAALLLAVTGIVGLIVARSGEGEMATSLLLPLRVLGIIPAILGVLAAIVVVVAPTASVGYSALGLIFLLMLASTGLLIRNWRKVRA